MRDLLIPALDAFHLSPNEGQLAAFERYATLLIAWNSHTNLTSVSSPEGIALRHFADSLTLLHALPAGSPGLRLIDVGSGAGFPGLPLAIMRPDLQVTVLEATGKKVRFLDSVVADLKLPNVRTLNARAEEAGQDRAERAAYDIVAARAVAPLRVLAEYLLPFARIGGRCIAQKGPNPTAEIEEAQNALRLLGGRLILVEQVQVPGLEQIGALIHIEKITATPAAYPRRPGTPSKNPL